MSYSDQILRTKLSSLDETQATIVSISEWILFHHRNASDSIKTWAKYIQESSSNQKLPLFYLANEIIQKAAMKRKPEFLKPFAEVIPNVLSEVYPKLDPKIQLKYKRVLDIWKDRSIFSGLVLDEFYNKIKGGSRDKLAPQVSVQRKMTDVAPELIPLSSAYNRLSHSSSLFSSSHLKFEAIYKELFENEYNLPLPEIFISKLDKLSRLSNESTNSLNDIISIRESLIRDLNRVITSQTELIKSDNAKLEQLATKSTQVKEKRKELEEYVNGDTSAMSVDAAGDNNDDDDEDELIPTYAASDSEDENPSPAKKLKIDTAPESKVAEEDDDEEVSPAYEKDDSDSDSDTETDFGANKSINPNLASLLSKLSE